MLVAGVDGCRAGWVVVLADISEPQSIDAVVVVANFAAVLALTEACEAVVVDIPIGLSLRLPRQADVLARALLRPNRGSSVFPSPVRAVLQATTYDSACKVSRGACGKAISRQTFGILSKIREVDNLMTTDLQLRVGESHPELSFAALNQGRPVDGKKKTRQGRCERAELLGEAQRTDLAHLTVPAGAAPDDVFDARILAWTAQRKAGGRARRLPESEQRDARGLKMEISY